MMNRLISAHKHRPGPAVEQVAAGPVWARRLRFMDGGSVKNGSRFREVK